VLYGRSLVFVSTGPIPSLILLLCPENDLNSLGMLQSLDDYPWMRAACHPSYPSGSSVSIHHLNLNNRERIERFKVWEHKLRFNY